MSKKEKTVFALEEDFQTVIAAIPKLKAVIKAQREIAAAYQKYRKNGGEAIPGIEKYFGIKEQESTPAETQEIAASPQQDEAIQDVIVTKKAKKKSKK